MNSTLVVVGLFGFGGLIVTTIYETWLGVSLREPSMTRILFGASVSLKLLLIATLSYVLVAIHNPAGLDVEHFGISWREYARAILYGGLAVQATGVTIALFRWDRRAVRIANRTAEGQLVERQQELHGKIERLRAQEDKAREAQP